MRNLLEMTLQNSEVKTYFAQGLKVKNEEEILLKNGEVLRPDRLVFEGNDVSIIDYKTGEANATHQEQILGYKLYIEQMGYKVKKCVLVYINEESIELERV
jgi:CRISPR/Cas system-associated exonuclease Cas4 (RecB family)